MFYHEVHMTWPSLIGLILNSNQHLESTTTIYIYSKDLGYYIVKSIHLLIFYFWVFDFEVNTLAWQDIDVGKMTKS